MALDLSSLGRAESRVHASLDSVSFALVLMGGVPPLKSAQMPSQHQFFRGEKRLAQNTEALFGKAPNGRAGRILVTLGSDSAEDPAVLEHIVEQGADAVRINYAHDERAGWEKMIAHVRAAKKRAARRIRILMDIAGPKVRTTDVSTPPDRNRLLVGDELLLSQSNTTDPNAPAFRAGCTAPQVFERLKIGDCVSIDDGKLRGTIVRQTHAGFVARIAEGRQKGLKLKAEKGRNFPNIGLGLDPLTARDKSDLDFIVRHADMIGYSFVETASHVAQLQKELAARRDDWQSLGLVAKIETPRAVHNLPDIVVEVAGRQPLAVMIARGDLAVELGFERVAEMQEEILWLCEAANVPAIWATQALEGLVSKGMPSRGEMTDAAMSARAECVVLNKGSNVTAGIKALDRLLHRMGEHQTKKTPTLRALHSWEN